MSNTSSMPVLLERIQRLKQRYPDSSLIAEFITYAANEYAVRALVLLGDRTLATAMAAASTLESAEDRAKIRAIDALGMDVFSLDGFEPIKTDIAQSPPEELFGESFSPEISVLEVRPNDSLVAPTSQLPTRPKRSKPTKPERLSHPSPQSSPISISSLSSDPVISANDQDSVPPSLGDPDSSLSLQPVISGSFDSPVEPSLDSVPSDLSDSSVPVLTDVDFGESNQAIQDNDSSSIPFEGGSNANLVDAIAKTSVEMHRLGWDTHQGRQYLQSTYGKRSRGELTDEELLDFLHFLEKQPIA